MSDWSRPTRRYPGPPMTATTEDWLQDAAVLRDLLAKAGVDGEGPQPIHRWIRNLENVAHQRVLETAEHVAPAIQNLAMLADVYGARLLAWSARVLLARPEQVQIDNSLIARELAAADFTGKGEVLMPGGVGTFVVAARCVHLEEGSARLFGTGTTSQPDVRWLPKRGGEVVFERKDRAFVRASLEPASMLERILIQRALDACRQLPEMPDVVRIALVGAAAPAHVVDEIGPRFSSSIVGPFQDRATRGETVPDGAGALLMGFDVAPRAEQVTNMVRFSLPTEGTQAAWRALEEVFHEERLRASGALNVRE